MVSVATLKKSIYSIYAKNLATNHLGGSELDPAIGKWKRCSVENWANRFDMCQKQVVLSLKFFVVSCLEVRTRILWCTC